jgi:hypothetical protein
LRMVMELETTMELEMTREMASGLGMAADSDLCFAGKRKRLLQLRL